MPLPIDSYILTFRKIQIFEEYQKMTIGIQEELENGKVKQWKDNNIQSYTHNLRKLQEIAH